MKPTVALKEPQRNPTPKTNEMRLRFYRWQGELLEKYVPLPVRRTDGTQFLLNTELWDAFCKNDKQEMLRLAKAGADPHSIERRIDRKEKGLPI